jgi:hypothetical protein
MNKKIEFDSASINVIIDSYKPARKLNSSVNPDDPEEIEFDARLTLSQDGKLWNLSLTAEQVEILGIEESAINYCRRDNE